MPWPFLSSTPCRFPRGNRQGRQTTPGHDENRSVNNLADFAVDGHVWALTSFTERVQTWRVGSDRYCTRRDAEGTRRWGTWSQALSIPPKNKAAAELKKLAAVMILLG